MSMPGDVTVINTLSIQNNAPAPIVRSDEVLGGAQSVASLAARDAIPAYLRQEGMYAYVVATTQTFQLVGGILNANWTAASGSGSLQSAYNGGNTIALAGALPVAISSTTADDGDIVQLTKNPVGAQAGNGMTVSMGATTTGNGITVTMTAGATGLALLASGGSISSPDGASSERFGAGATAANSFATVMGHGASSAGMGGVAIGFSAAVNAGASTAIGGAGATASGNNSTVLGYASNDASFSNCTLLGANLTGTAANQTMIGGFLYLGGASTAIRFIESPDGSTAPVSSVTTGRLRYNNTTGHWEVSTQGGAYTPIMTGASSLQSAYNNGNTIAEVGGLPVAISSTTADNSSVMTLTKNPAVMQSGAGLSVSMGANTTGDGIMVTMTTGATGLAGLFSGGAISCPDGPASERFGAGATAAGTDSTVVGATASSASSSSVAVGFGANAPSGTFNVAVGSGASATNAGIAIGGNTSATGGAGASLIALGFNAGATAGQFVAGSTTGAITSVFFGNGSSSGVPVACTINGTGGIGAGVAGGLIRVAAGLSGDNATAGRDVRLGVSVAGSGMSTTDVVYVSSANGGSVGIGASPGAFTLDVTGNTRVTGKLTVTGAIDPMSILLSGGTALYFESNDGSTAPVSGATTGRLRYNDTTGTWQVSMQGGAYNSLLTSASVTLQEAYNGGATIAEAGGVPVAISSTTADNANVLTIAKTPAGSQSGNAVDIAMSNTTTGNGIHVNMNTGATGSAISIQSGASTNAAVNVTTSGIGGGVSIVNNGSGTGFHTSQNSGGHGFDVSLGPASTGNGLNVTMSVGSTGSAVVISGGATTTSRPLFSATQTWNNAGTVFTGILSNITDSASNATSLLLDLQVGGSSKLNVDKFGSVIAQGLVQSVTGSLIANLTHDIGWSATPGALDSSRISNYADGVVGISNNTVSAAFLILGNQTAAFPALKRSLAVLQTRLANDSDFCDFATGNATVNGKLTVTGAIDPASLSLSGGTALFIDSADGSTAPVSAAAHARIRYNNGATQWEQSINGGAYTAFGGTVSLQAAYNGGNTIVEAGGVPVGIGSTTADDSNILNLSKNPVGAQAGVGLSVTMGATTTGSGVAVAMTAGSTGAAVNIALTGGGNGVAIAQSGATGTPLSVIHSSNGNAFALTSSSSTLGGSQVIYVQSTGANDADVLYIDRVPAGTQAGNGIFLSMGATTTGNGITVTMAAGAAGLAALFTGASISCPDVGSGSERFGLNAQATGSNGVAVGNGAASSGQSTVVVGAGLQPTGQYIIDIGQPGESAVGFDATTTDIIAIGDGVEAQPGVGGAAYLIAIGAQPDIQNATLTIAMGYKATAQGGTNLIAIGTNANATSSDSTTINDAVTIGNGSQAGAIHSVALGASNTAGQLSGDSDIITVGFGNNMTSGVNLIGIGNTIGSAGSNNVIGIGSSINFTGSDSIAMGRAVSAGTQTVSIGSTSSAPSSSGVAVGYGVSIPTGADDSVVVGASAFVSSSSSDSVVIGSGASSTAASGSVVVGFQATSGNTINVSIGQFSAANGFASVSMGWEASTLGDKSVGIGGRAWTFTTDPTSFVNTPFPNTFVSGHLNFEITDVVLRRWDQ